jgi:metal-responsive CopG/Arc/MetJ family transcriptional regulator
MDDTKRRVNLMLDSDVIEMLDELAEGERKRGQYISQLIRSAYAAKRSAPDVRSMDLDALRLMVQGLAGRVLTIEGEIINLQSQLAALNVQRGN